MTQGYTNALTLPLPLSKGGTGAVLTLPVITKINTQTITATGAFTYTPTSGTQYAIFELQGGGGGSGGSTGAGGQAAVPCGGGGGAYMRILVSGSANLAAITGSVGIAGTAGTAGNNSGGAGGNTTLIINSGSTWTAGGGAAGTGITSSASAQGCGTLVAGGTNTTGTNGTLILSVEGQSPKYGFSNGSTLAVIMSSGGGDSFLGHGGAATQSTGKAGLGYGGGASSSYNGTGGSLGGLAGSQGIVIVTEFISV